MAKFIIEGSTPLVGEVTVPGNKNAVLPTMAASLLTDDEIVLENVPHIHDVRTMGLLLQDIGVSVTGTNTRVVRLGAKNAASKQPSEKLVADLRASILLLGPMLARFGAVTLRHPGGDIIGRRSIDPHLKALVQLGATVEKSGIVNTISAKKLVGAKIHLSEASVTATENLMMAACVATGETVITNAASEPHVVCLGTLLQSMGASVEGLGTSTLRLKGVSRLHGASHKVRPDYIEVGTWIVAAAATGGDITIHSAHPDDLLPFTSIFAEMGVSVSQIQCKDHPAGSGLVCIRAKRTELVAYPHLRTNVWPGFPTDLMSPTLVLATQSRGTTLAHDWMYEGRMFFVDRLIKMGANIIIADPHRVIINGPTPLFGRHSASPDIRAGIALVIAAISAKGKSEINMVELINRGYENLEKRLIGLGAKLRRVDP